MRRSVVAVLGVVGSTVGLVAGTGPAVGAAAPAGRAAVQAPSSAATPSNEVGTIAASTPIDFSVGLQLRDPAGAAALEEAVSDPSSPSYRQYLTTAQWESRFSPSSSTVSEISSWLRSQGLTVESVTPDRMTVHAAGTAAQIESAFGTSLGDYRVEGQTVRLASSQLTVPAALSGVVAGVNGVDQILATHDAMTSASKPASPSTVSPPKAPANLQQPPPGSVDPPNCAAYYGQQTNTTDPPFGTYSAPTQSPCGYSPAQLQSAYGLTSRIAGGNNGFGATVAIVDAYASPTLYQDAHTYSVDNQPGQVLLSSQFSERNASTFDLIHVCGGNNWYPEQTLDVEAVHATAPGAHILYVGAQDCAAGLNDALQAVVDHRWAQVVTDSWGVAAGDVADSPGDRAMVDNVLLLAGGTGITVLFASGDDGDSFSGTGVTSPEYPASSPYAVAVGGTTLQVGAAGSRIGEFGWSTAVSAVCTAPLAAASFPGCTTANLGAWDPLAPGKYAGGGGGGVSIRYAQPKWQAGVVPPSLAATNSSVTGHLNRVVPDISLDADPATGFEIGETQTFPSGIAYGQYAIGGTSLASPLFAGMVADADQAAGTSLGFLDPALYGLAKGPARATAFFDVTPGGKQLDAYSVYLDGTDSAQGVASVVNVITDEGLESFCSAPSTCRHQLVTLKTAPGYDSMTGLGSPGAGLVADLAGS